MRQWRDGRNGTDQLPHSKEAEELMGEGETSEGMVLGKAGHPNNSESD